MDWSPNERKKRAKKKQTNKIGRFQRCLCNHSKFPPFGADQNTQLAFKLAKKNVRKKKKMCGDSREFW